MRVDGLFVRERFFVARYLEQLALRVDLLRVANERSHDVELSSSQTHGSARRGKLARLLVYDPLPKRHRAICLGRLPKRRRTTQQRLDARQLFVQIERLDHIVVRPHTQKGYTVGCLPFRRGDEDRNAAALANAGDQLFPR